MPVISARFRRSAWFGTRIGRRALRRRPPGRRRRRRAAAPARRPKPSRSGPRCDGPAGVHEAAERDGERAHEADEHAELRAHGSAMSGGSMIRRRISTASTSRAPCGRAAPSGPARRARVTQREDRADQDDDPQARERVPARRGRRDPVVASTWYQTRNSETISSAAPTALRTRPIFGLSIRVNLRSRTRSRRSGGISLLLAQPLGGRADAVAHVDPRLPAEQPLGLLHRRPAALDVDLEARQVLELELGRVVARRLPADRGDLGDGALLARRDVEVLVEPVRVAGRGDDAVGDVVDVRQRPRLLAGAEDRQRRDARQRLADQVRARRGRCPARRRASRPARRR